MSYAESPKKTVERFSRVWSTTDPNSLLSEFISISKETNREPDTYHFSFKGRILIDPNTNRPVLDFIAEGVEKDVARDLESWASSHEEGAALWVSPKKEGVYPCPKVIIHRIAYNGNGEKVLLNSVILFDSEIKNPEYKRRTIYTIPDTEENIFKILEWVKRTSKETLNLEPTEKTSYEQAIYFTNQIQNGVSKDIVMAEMQRTGFLGVNSISCPISFSEFVSGRSVVSEVKLIKNCGNCKAILNIYMKSGDSCPHCKGIYRGC